MSLLGTGAAIAVTAKLVSDARELSHVGRQWQPLVRGAAARYDVSVHVLNAIFYKESRFDPLAVGTAGERGLGQFKPIAAEDVNVDFGELATSPGLQIEAAAALLSLNRGRLNGDLYDSVRAYNVGVGKARTDSVAGQTYALDILWLALTGWIASTLGLFGKGADVGA